MSYLHFYHLKKEPFNVTPDPEFLFLSPSHKEALGVFIYGITKRKGIVAVIGEVGVGKTTVLRSYLEGVNPESLKTIYLFNANVSFSDLMRTLCDELNVTPKNENVFDMVTEVHHALIEEYKKGRNVVLIVDEAQNMPVDTLENLRMLSNLETSKDKLIQIALIGQPELEEKLNLHELRQLKQRIAVRSTIRPLTSEESMDYIQHRLAKCRMKTEPIFTAGALKEVVSQSKGIPRLMNILCDNALITGFGYQQRPVGTRIIKEVISDFKGEQYHPAYRWAVASALALALVAVLVWAFASRAGSDEGSAAATGKNISAIAPSSQPSTPTKKDVTTKPTVSSVKQPREASHKEAPKATPASSAPAPHLPAKSATAQANAGIIPTNRPASVGEDKPKSGSVGEDKSKSAPVITEKQAPKSSAPKTQQAASHVRSEKEQATRAAADQAKIEIKSQTTNYAKNATKKSTERPRPQAKKQYADSQKSRVIPAAKTERHPYPYNPGRTTPAEDLKPKEVPSELIEDPETISAPQDLAQLSEPATDAPATPNTDQQTEATEGTEGAGSAGNNVVEPPTQNAVSPPQEPPPAKEDANEQVPLSSDVTAPKILRASKPVYPYSAQLRRIEGTVIVSVLVSPVGDVEAVRILRSAGSNYGLDQAAVAAVKRWKFTPAVQNGKRVRVWVSYPILFKLK
jgi:general secretion pathway protein A